MSRKPPIRDVRARIDLSIVVPLFNELATIAELPFAVLNAVLLLVGTHAEIVYVDDGSSDGTREALDALALTRRPRRPGAARQELRPDGALAAGFDAAHGAVIVAMDGDLQHAPEEIPKLLAKLDEGYDVVSGWRRAAGGQPVDAPGAVENSRTG